MAQFNTNHQLDSTNTPYDGQTLNNKFYINRSDSQNQEHENNKIRSKNPNQQYHLNQLDQIPSIKQTQIKNQTISNLNELKPLIKIYLICTSFVTVIFLITIFVIILTGAYLNIFKTSKISKQNQNSISTDEAKIKDINNDTNLEYNYQLINDWKYFDEMEEKKVQDLDLNITANQQIVVSFQNVIPTTKKIKQAMINIMIVNLRPEKDQNNNVKQYDYTIRIRVINEGKNYMHWIHGYRGGQYTIVPVWNSQSIRFPMSQARQLRIKSSKAQLFTKMAIYIAGWRE